MVSIAKKFSNALQTTLSGRERKWAIGLFLMMMSPAPYYWSQGESVWPLFVIGLLFSFQMLASSVNGAWHGSKLNDETGWVSIPTKQSWSYLIVEYVISIVFLSIFLSYFLDRFTVYICLVAFIIPSVIADIWKYRDQIFVKAASK